MKVSIPLDTATPTVQRVLSGLRGSRHLARYGGRKVQAAIGEHVLDFAANNHATAQKLGARPTGFYSDAYEQVTAPGAVEVQPNKALLNLPRAAFARAFGDVEIKPGAGKKYLTFAAVGFAYGRRAGSFANLTFGFAKDPETGKLRKALVEAEHTTIDWKAKGRKGAQVSDYAKTSGGRAVYWLVTKANQKQNRDLLPSDNEIRAAALEGAAEYIDTLVRAKGGTP